MDHVSEQSKEDRKDKSCDPEGDSNDTGSYYYDDATNYETYRDDDDEETATQTENPAD
jgi:hypothetical protein